MANMNLSNPEMGALGDAVLKSYCSAVNEDFANFKKQLTGNLRIYENLSDAVTDYLNDENVLAYIETIQESTVKNGLKKWAAEKKTFRQQAAGPWVSPNNLRKLIFYGPKETQSSFKEFFVFGCYIYAGIDRTVLLKELKASAPVLKHTLGLTQFVPGMDTVPPHKRLPDRKFTLVALNRRNEEHFRLTFETNGEPTLLNRSNLDPDNNTITSKVQASLYVVDGEWYIENGSEQKTTFIQVTKPTKLEKGDIVVFGNRYFLFED